MRELLYGAKARSGSQSSASPLGRSVNFLFELYWQEMDTLVRDADRAVHGVATGPRFYSASEFRQLAYGAMVSYDRAWQKFRRTGDPADMHGALWRNVHMGTDTISEAALLRLFRYVEHLKQTANRWTEAQLAAGDIDWGELPEEVVQAQDEEARDVRLTYTAERYDGSRVKAGESIGVPLSWQWWSPGFGVVTVENGEQEVQRLPSESQEQHTAQLTAEQSTDKG